MLFYCSVKQIIPPALSQCGIRLIPAIHPSDCSICCLRADPRQSSDLPGHGTDNILRSIHCHADNIDILLPVGNPHPSDHILSVLMQNLIQRIRRIVVFHHNPDYRHTSGHLPCPGPSVRQLLPCRYVLCCTNIFHINIPH